MNKIYHVFVSSTYSDLIDERKKVSEAIAKAGHVAEGMEIFPASSQSQMDFIERVIDRCDYYVLILAGRYGSTGSDGISYTQKEFEYALKKNIPVLAFLHKDVSSIKSDYVDRNEEDRKKLDNLKDKLKENSLVDFWSNGDELATKALAALSHVLQSHPGIGWMRADNAAGEDLLNEVNNLRKLNDDLSAQLKSYQTYDSFGNINLARLDEEFTIRYKYYSPGYASSNKKISITWADILRAIGPTYRTASNSSGMDHALNSLIRERIGATDRTSITVEMRDKHTILMHFEAQGIMSANNYSLKGGGSGTFHQLSNAGLKKVLELNVVHSNA